MVCYNQYTNSYVIQVHAYKDHKPVQLYAFYDINVLVVYDLDHKLIREFRAIGNKWLINKMILT